MAEIGTVWASGTWATPAWAADTWGDSLIVVMSTLDHQWRGIESSGNTALDSITDVEDAMSNFPVDDSQWINPGINFDGVNDLIDISGHGDLPLDISTPFAVMFWMNCAHVSGDTVPISFGSTTSNSPIFRLRVIAASDKMRVTARNDSASEFINRNSTTVVADGTYHHVAATLEGGTLKLFVDGVLEQTQNFTYSTTTFNRATIGALGRGAYLQYFNGILRGVRIYTGAGVPDAAAITAIMAEPVYDVEGGGDGESKNESRLESMNESATEASGLLQGNW